MKLALRTWTAGLTLAAMPLISLALAPTSVAQDPCMFDPNSVECQNYDAVFVANLKKAGWNVWDPADVVPHAHTVCAALRNGDTPPSLSQQLVTVGLLYPHEAGPFVAAAMASYPNCP